MSQPLRRLDLFETPLSGLNLIEASAGTGKTYTITGLYLRLLLEAERPVNRILVVTYTKAATEELRDRIRRRLVEARRAFVEGASEDPFCQQLLARQPDRELAIRRLTNGVRGFDEAAIFTIHGFCQRVLADSAFESGMAFQTELLPDVRELLQEIVDDFWRREFYGASPLLVNFLLEKDYSPEKLLHEIRSYLGKPYLKVLGPENPPNLAEAEGAFSEAYEAVRELWRGSSEAVKALLSDNASLNGNKYRKTSIPGWLTAMDDYLAPQGPNLALFPKFEKFTAAHLAASVKKGKNPPEHPFFMACDELQGAHGRLAEYYDWYLRALRVRLLKFTDRELGLRKRQQQVRSYDDLLIDLHRALQAAHGQALAEAVRRRYSAALIDEFQDTDPIQYDIFHRIYTGSGLPVFLVGDPKQAIYSFRGADIFAYLAARDDADGRYTLDVNWRSDPALIQAINTLFQQTPRPFLFETIPFQPAAPAHMLRTPLVIQGKIEAPFELWFLGVDDNDKSTTKGRANDAAAQATAAEIARLLNLGVRGEARIGDRSLEGGDIAILVRNHRQGRLVRKELLRLGVPSVQQAQDDVFDTWEAQELEWLLMAVAEPGRESRIRAALATDLLGMTGEDVHRLGIDEQAWEQRLEAFHDYRRLWREHGFMRMFRTLLAQEGAPRRLLDFQDGERRLTNVLHLGELLQVAASRERMGMEGLVKWLSERRHDANRGEDEHLLRLESDAHLVKIVTVHKSKGLEYPIVFCPFLWDGKLWSEKSESFAFHNPRDTTEALLDLGSDRQEIFRPYARDEELAENLRLLYVALTRARYRCCMVWGDIREAGSSAPAWLLHQPNVVGPDRSPVEAVAERFDGMDKRAIWEELGRVVAQAEGAITVTPLSDDRGVPYRPPQQPGPQLQARHFAGAIEGKWRISSFTALSAGHGAELPDYDVTPFPSAPETPVVEGRTIFSFPRGARAGSCLHLIFERLDFTGRDRLDLEALVARTLLEHGFEAEWTGVVADMVERVLATPLDGRQVRLGRVASGRRLNELEFYYPLGGINAEGLRQILVAHGLGAGPFGERIESLDFNPVRGFMKGFIDLVFEADGRFYLVDYKSNWLGADTEAYDQEAVAAAMARDSYYLQYLIYSVALHRYLGLRLPDYDYERHFGGVFYLFLRGMDPRLGSDYGVFRDRPARGLVEALDGYMG